MRWKRKLEIIEDNPQSPKVSRPQTSVRTGSDSGSAVFLKARSNSHSQFKFQVSPRSTASGIESPESITNFKSASHSKGLSLKYISHEELSPRILSPTSQFKTTTQSSKSHRHTKSEYSLGTFNFFSQGGLISQKQMDPKELIPSNLFKSTPDGKHSLPELLNNGCEIISPHPSSKIVSPRATISQFHSKTQSVQLNSNSPSKKKETVKIATGVDFFKPGASQEKESEANEKPLIRPQTSGTVYFERKPHTPARFLKVKNLTTHRFAAENYGMIEKVREEYNLDDAPGIDGPNDIVENYRKKLNQQFSERFCHYAPHHHESLATLHEEYRGKHEPDMIPSLEVIGSERFELSSPSNSMKNPSIIRGSTTRKTMMTLASLTKLDARKGTVKIVDPNKRPAAVGLPDNAMRIQPSMLDFEKGKSNRGILKRKTTRKVTKGPKEEKAVVEDKIMEEMLEKELDIVAPPSKLSALQQLNDAKFQNVLRKKSRLLKGQQPTFKRIRQKLLEMLNEMKRLKLNPKDLMESKIFSSYPFQKPKSKELIMACKSGNFDHARELLYENKFLVYDFDQYHLTALHWSIRRGFFSVSKLLIDKGADVNAKDLIGRTPLYFAIMENRVDLVKLLLHAQCDPWSTEEANYMEISSKKPLIRYFLSKSRQVHIVMKMTPPHLRGEVWEKQTLDWIMNPNRLDDSTFKEFDEELLETERATTTEN